MKNYALLLSLLALSQVTCQPPIEEYSPALNPLIKSREKHTEAFTFCKQNGFDTTYCFLIDLSIHSGKSRFFIWDFHKKNIIDSSLVTHGSCKQEYSSSLTLEKTSNIPESHCSSLGKYRIGKRDYSSWGINVKYWIHGLEKSNSNAVKRVVVLHSWSLMDTYPIYPDTSPESWGCPAVSDEFMHTLDKKLKSTKKPVLLWIYL